MLAALSLGASIAIASPVAVSSPPSQVVVIQRSASTNTAAFTIAVTRTGTVTMTTGTVVRSATIPRNLAGRLYFDLNRAGALSALPVEHCMKSASFGTTTSIVSGGERSPDLECAQSPPGQALNADARAIVEAATSGAPSDRRRTQPIHIRRPPPE